MRHLSKARVSRGTTERVALADVAGLQAPAQPLLPLLGRAVCEALRHHVPLRLFLKPVVADGGRRAQPFFDVPFIEPVAAGGVIAPDAGVAVGLQFLANGERVALGFGRAGPHLVHAARHPGQRLDVMADLVGDDVGLGEVSWRAEALIQLAEEREVDVELVITRTVERPDG